MKINEIIVTSQNF